MADKEFIFNFVGFELLAVALMLFRFKFFVRASNRNYDVIVAEILCSQLLDL